MLGASLAPRRLEWRVLLPQQGEDGKEAKRDAQDPIPKDHSEVVDPEVRKDRKDRKDQERVKELANSSAKASAVKVTHVPTHISLVESPEENQDPRPLLLDHHPRSL